RTPARTTLFAPVTVTTVVVAPAVTVTVVPASVTVDASRSIVSPAIVWVTAGKVTVRSGNVTVVVTFDGRVTIVVVPGAVVVSAGAVTVTVIPFVCVSGGTVIVVPGTVAVVVEMTVVVTAGRAPVGMSQLLASTSAPVKPAP